MEAPHWYVEPLSKGLSWSRGRMRKVAYKYMGTSLDTTPAALGTVLLTRALAQAAASPLCGLLGDRVHRGAVIGVGCLLYGSMTAALGMSQTLRQVHDRQISTQANLHTV